MITACCHTFLTFGTVLCSSSELDSMFPISAAIVSMKNFTFFSVDWSQCWLYTIGMNKSTLMSSTMCDNGNLSSFLFQYRTAYMHSHTDTHYLQDCHFLERCLKW